MKPTSFNIFRIGQVIEKLVQLSLRMARQTLQMALYKAAMRSENGQLRILNFDDLKMRSRNLELDSFIFHFVMKTPLIFDRI